MKVPIEIFNHVLSYRPTHTIAKMLNKHIKGYHDDMVEYPSHSRTVIHGRTGQPYQKQYYDIKSCAKYMSFYQYCLNYHDYEIYSYVAASPYDFTD